MSIFEEMSPPSASLTHYELQEIEGMLQQAIERGHVRELPVSAAENRSVLIRWFEEPVTGIIFELSYFGERSSAMWRRVDPTNLATITAQVQ